MSLEKLLGLDVSTYVEKKNGLSYLSWANAWREFIKVYPNATYTILKDTNMNCWFGNGDMGYMVYTTVTAGELTHEMWLPVMDLRNKSMTLPTTFDINKAVMRCLTKNLAMFGLGLYIYAGEDLPEQSEEEIKLEREAEVIRHQPVGDMHIAKIKSLLEVTGKNEADMLTYVEAKSIEEMNMEQFLKAKNALEKKAKK